MTYADNIEYKEVFHSTKHNVRFYMPANESMGYHVSRYQEAGQQHVYASCGITREYMDAITHQMLEVINDKKKYQLSDVAVLVNNLRYRLQYPVDEDCALRMSAVYIFVEGEDPAIPQREWINKKLEWAKSDPDLYAFFLNMGLMFTPSWKEYLPGINEINDYLTNRQQILSSLLPIASAEE